MTDESKQNETGIDDAERSAIREICDDHGFPVGNVDAGGEMLVLTPTSLAELPDAEVLGRLADALEERGYGFVTFEIPDPDKEGQR